MRSRAVATLVAGALWGGEALRLAALWDRLPARLATHFGVSGAADGWMERSGFVTLTFAFGGGLTLLLLASGSWLRHVPPEMINVPHCGYWLAPERREQGIARLSGWMAWLAVLMAGFFIAMTELVVHANLAVAPGETIALESRTFVPVLVGFLTLVAAWMAALYVRLRPPKAT
jgi:hypothetical protein